MTSIASRPTSYAAGVATAAALAALADFFFYGHEPGITVPLFALALVAGMIALHPRSWRGATLPPALGGVLIGIAPLAENVSPLSFMVGLIAVTLFSLSVSGRLKAGVSRVARQLPAFYLVAPFRFIADFFRWRRAARRIGRRSIRLASLLVWIMPLSLGLVFLVLFGAANPIIEHWISLFDLWWLFELAEPIRIAFWVLVVAATWAFLRPRLPKLAMRPQCSSAAPYAPVAAQPAPAEQGRSIEDVLFGRAAILRALIVFNLLFAVQTALDAVYLWGGAELPDGLSYAAYAHRGAYPLIVTALLAAGFVLAAMRPASETEGDSTIRRLVYLWTAQNIVLVISSILRLDLYVGIYSLTYWRVAAFIWMGLVAAGLALIIARIATRRSNEWLLSANLLTLSATLYACCYINLAGLIAGYNVDHSLEMSGQGVPLDICYIVRLGPQALPAIDRVGADRVQPANYSCGEALPDLRSRLEADHRRATEGWRAWTFRAWRLNRYLAGRESPPRLDLPDPAH